METYLTRNDEGFDSIAWAFEVHIGKPDTRYFNSAVLIGNEDCPSEIRLYRAANPRFDAKFVSWTPATEGGK